MNKSKSENMKKLNDDFIKVAPLMLLFLIMIFASCHTNRQLSDYPNFNSLDQKKYVLQVTGINTQSHQKHIGLSKTDNTPQIVIKENKINSQNTKTKYFNELVSKSYLNEIISKPELLLPKNNQGSLLASLSFKPVITSFSFYPDTNKLNSTQTIDSSAKLNSISLAPTVNDNNSKAIKQKNAAKFASISFIAALLIIPAIFIFPGLFFLFAIAAIVFGALGIKSTKRKMAIAGMIIGIVTLSLILLVALIYFLGGPVVLA